MANDNQHKTTIRLAGAASILIATLVGYFWAPFGSAYGSAGILGGVAALSFAARGLFTSKN